MPPAEEYALDAAVQRDDPIESVFREHYPRLVGMLARLTGGRAQAEDIAADVFCKLAARRLLPAGSDGITAWMYRVAANAGLDALRMDMRRRRREEAAGAEQYRAAPHAGALEDMLREERRRKVRSVLDGLKPRDARLLILRFSGLKYKELAETVGVAPASVGALLARAETEFEREYRARFGDAK